MNDEIKMPSRLGEIMECIGAVVTALLFAFMAWAFLCITPDQCSAEADACRVEMEATSR